MSAAKTTFLCGVALGLAAAAFGQAPDVPSKAPAWRPAAAADVRAAVFAWLDERKVDPPSAPRPSSSGPDHWRG